jgi:general secretion pathway protein I
MASVISAEKAFTLLEVMIALAVAAIALVSLLFLGNRTIELESEQRAVTMATMLAQRKMTEVETLYRLHQASEITNEGVFAEPFERYRWNITFNDTVLPAVLQVTVSVLWGAREKMQKVDLVSFVLRDGG